MWRRLWIPLLIHLEWSCKTNGQHETTINFQTRYQQTVLKNESLISVRSGAIETEINNFSSSIHNDLITSGGTTKAINLTASFELLSNVTTSEVRTNPSINLTLDEQEEDWNYTISEEIPRGSTDRPLQLVYPHNISEQSTSLPTVHVKHIENNNIISISENKELLTKREKSSSTISSQTMDNSTTVEQTYSIRDSISEQDDIINQHITSSTLFEPLNSSSISFGQNDLTTEMPSISTEEHSFQTTRDTFSPFKTSDNFDDIKKLIDTDITTNDVTETYTTHVERKSSEDEPRNFSLNLQTSASTNYRNVSEYFSEITSLPVNRNEILQIVNQTHSTEEFHNISQDSFSGNQNDTTKEYSKFINQSTQEKNHSAKKISTITIFPTAVPTEESQQKVKKISSTFSSMKSDGTTTIPMTAFSTITTTSTIRRKSPDSIQMTSSTQVSSKSSQRMGITVALPTRVTSEDYQQTAFFFKHVNNLTDSQRNNMTINIIFISMVDIVEWFHSYDGIFRAKIASFQTKRDGSKPFQSMNIIYIAPTPLKNEKYFCVSFMVQSTFNIHNYEHGELIVEKINQNLSDLAQTLQLPIESVTVGYNDTGKCHRINTPIQERNWTIIVVLSIILIIAIAMILAMCIQKTKNETLFHSPWEDDVQEWNGTINNGTGRYRCTPQLPINLPRQLKNMDENSPKVNLKDGSKDDGNPFVPNNGVENVLIHNEEKNYPDSSNGENNETYIEDTKL